MGETTAINWADSTFNPWTGCTKVSPGCANCYAEKMCNRFAHLGKWGPGAERKRTGEAYWRKPLAWNRKAEAAEDARELFLGCGQGPDATWEDEIPSRSRVFCGSLCDWLDPEAPIGALADLLALIATTPHLDWLLLTKRPENWRLRLSKALDWADPNEQNSGDWLWLDAWLCGDPPDNVWLGVTAEDQQRADERHEHLREIPARVRFYSAEPLLEWVVPDLDGIHWAICGGESGRNARPMHPDWARSLRDQCQEAGVPFFFKQWGEWSLSGVPGKKAVRVGKKKAGRLLDGRTWDEFPGWCD